MGCLWFNRSEAKDRLAIAQKYVLLICGVPAAPYNTCRIKAHIQNPSNNPLLVFPEGVCVNNEYCVMFKKGVSFHSENFVFVKLTFG
jgi:glycerol-3-phosphate O-acyltransferase 3/4